MSLCLISGITVVIWRSGTDSDVEKESAYYANIPLENKDTEIIPEKNNDISGEHSDKSDILDTHASHHIMPGTTQLINTIQTGSFHSAADAQKQFDLIVKRLNRNELDSLRIEKVGRFYSVRIGKFENYATAEKFLQTIKHRIAPTMILEAYIKDNRIIKRYKKSILSDI